jgi:hypothetical protein
MMKRKRDAEDDASTDDQFNFEDDFDEKEHERQQNFHEVSSTFQMEHELHQRIHSSLAMDHHHLVHHLLVHHHPLTDDTLLKYDNNLPSIPWTEEEDLKLTEAIDLYLWDDRDPPAIDWEKVSEHLESHRTADQCARRWNSAVKYRRPEFKPIPWTKQEDEHLELAVQQYEGQGLRGGVDWEKVRSQLGDVRTASQCRGRWNGILKHRSPLIKTTPWTTEEDNQLLAAIGHSDRQARRGAINWAAVSQSLGGMRSASQCSHRWNRVLKSRGISANTLPWTDEEDEQLRESAVQFYGQGLRGGVDWQKVAERMGGSRTPQQYGHRWNRVLKSKGMNNKNAPWTRDEDERLLEGISHFEGQGLRGAVDWGKVCEYMGGERSAQQCCHRWSGVLKHRGAMKFSPWAPEEDIRLTEAINLYQNQGLRGGVCWGKVSEYLNHERSCQQCAHRWNRVLKHRLGSNSGLNTSEWSEEEDERLRDAVIIFQGQGLRGGVDWGKVSEHLGNGRTSQQYCTRWNRVLKNNHQHHMKPLLWTELDDQKLIEAVRIFRGHGRGGTVDWMQVSKYVGNGRTREQNCGRWNGVLKHRQKDSERGVAEEEAGTEMTHSFYLPHDDGVSLLEDPLTENHHDADRVGEGEEESDGGGYL